MSEQFYGVTKYWKDMTWIYIHIYVYIYRYMYIYIYIYIYICGCFYKQFDRISICDKIVYIIFILNMDSVHLMSQSRPFGRQQGWLLWLWLLAAPGLIIIMVIYIGTWNCGYSFSLDKLGQSAFQKIMSVGISKNTFDISEIQVSIFLTIMLLSISETILASNSEFIVASISEIIVVRISDNSNCQHFRKFYLSACWKL